MLLSPLLEEVIHTTLTFLWSQATLAGNSPSSSCKASPGSNDWPSQSEWACLNRTVGGQLLIPTPPGAVCHPGEPSYDAERCVAVQSNWTRWDFHDKDPVSTMWNQFNNDTCLPIPTDPCSPAGYPSYVLNATSAVDVKRGVDFARKNNVRLVVKATGHDFVGRSNAPNALSIWTHNMKNIQFHDSFKPVGCGSTITTTAVTAAAGAQMYELYTALDSINQTMVGGGGKTVGIGGYMTGAGHSLLAGKFGLCADNVLQVELVTPMGDIITANECQHEDIFWAVRGGGGSTFGVITSITMRTYPTPPIASLNVGLAFLQPSKNVIPMFTHLLTHLPALSEAGVSGYFYEVPIYPNPLDGGATNISGVFGVFALPGSSNQTELEALMSPVFKDLAAEYSELQVWPNYTVYPTFLSWYETHYDQSPAGSDSYIGSWMLDKETLTSSENKTALLAAVDTFVSEAGATALMVAGPGVWNAKPRDGGNAVLPAWRKTVVHMTTGQAFAPLNATAKEEAKAAVNSMVEPMRQLAPNMGAYVNEAYKYEPEYQKTFWGDNYERLLSIKKRVDPEDVMWCHPCVGNEGWVEIDDQLCKVEH